MRVGWLLLAHLLFGANGVQWCPSKSTNVWQNNICDSVPTNTYCVEHSEPLSNEQIGLMNVCSFDVLRLNESSIV